jgi:hypothetical protein
LQSLYPPARNLSGWPHLLLQADDPTTVAFVCPIVSSSKRQGTGSLPHTPWLDRAHGRVIQ